MDIPRNHDKDIVLNVNSENLHITKEMKRYARNEHPMHDM